MSTLPTVHVFNTQPSLEELLKLSTNDVYLNLDNDTALYWEDGSFNLTLEPVLHNKSLYQQQLDTFENFIAIKISDIKYDTDVVESPYSFNSESGYIGYKTSFTVGNIENFKNCDFDIDSDHTYEDDYPSEVVDIINTINAFKNGNVAEILGSKVESLINDYINDNHEMITEYTKRNM